MKAMKTKLILSAMAGALALSACGKKEESSGGGGDAGPAAGPALVSPQTFPDTFDNSEGNPNGSIRGKAIVNRTFYLVDDSGSSTGLQNDLVLYFDNSGLLNAIATIEMGLFDGQAADGFGGEDSYDFSSFAAGANAQQTRGAVVFKASNIPYRFSVKTKMLEIGAFYATSRTQTVAPASTFNSYNGNIYPSNINGPNQNPGLVSQNQFGPAPYVGNGQVQNGANLNQNGNSRVAIRIAISSIKERKFLGKKFRTEKIEPLIKGELVDLNCDGSDSCRKKNPNSYGVNIAGNNPGDLMITLGDLQTQNQNYNWANPNVGAQPPMQIQTNPVFRPNSAKYRIVYEQPVLDQRGPRLK